MTGRAPLTPRAGFPGATLLSEEVSPIAGWAEAERLAWKGAGTFVTREALMPAQVPSFDPADTKLT